MDGYMGRSLDGRLAAKLVVCDEGGWLLSSGRKKRERKKRFVQTPFVMAAREGEGEGRQRGRRAAVAGAA